MRIQARIMRDARPAIHSSCSAKAAPVIVAAYPPLALLGHHLDRALLGSVRRWGRHHRGLRADGDGRGAANAAAAAGAVLERRLPPGWG